MSGSFDLRRNMAASIAGMAAPPLDTCHSDVSSAQQRDVQQPEWPDLIEELRKASLLNRGQLERHACVRRPSVKAASAGINHIDAPRVWSERKEPAAGKLQETRAFVAAGQ